MNAGKYKLVLKYRTIKPQGEWLVWEPNTALTELEGKEMTACIVSERTGQPIPDDEPIFILRGRDQAAKATLETYLELCEDAHTSLEHREGVVDAIRRFLKFDQENYTAMKKPGE